MTELHFKGKEFVYNHHLTVPHRPLVVHADKGIGLPRLDGNLIIQGDNLHALKALLPTHAGKVDCIFIDPPYNTGNEGWAYNDNVNSPMIKEWLEANPIGIEDGLRHDKWCAMMWPRLRLLWELLADEGSLWMTLDDNEVHHARAILDDLFGSGGFICQIAIQSNKRGQTYKSVAKTHEYLLVYGKTDHAAIRELETDGENLPETDHWGSYSPRELRNRNPKFGRHNRPNLFYPFFVDPNSPNSDGNYAVSTEKREGTVAVLPHNSVGLESCWRWGRQKSKQMAENGSTEHIFASRTRNGEWRIFEKYRKESVKAKTIWLDPKHISEQGTVELGKLGLADLFQFPKPLGLLEDVLAIAAGEDALILDSFAGSGTTAHAVLEANRRDGGNRRFILVEMEDYADRLTAERVRRVITGYPFKGTLKAELHRENLTWAKLQKADKLTETVEKIENLHGHEYDKITKRIDGGELIVTGERTVDEQAPGLGGEFTYCTLGDPIDMDRILSGDQLPDFKALGTVLFHTATNQTCDPALMDADIGYLGEAGGAKLWLVYKPDLAWLKTSQAALTLSYAQRIAAGNPETRHIVFAPANHTSPSLLKHHKIKTVEFAPLPYALYRVERG